jgi:hypothetical protein
VNLTKSRKIYVIIFKKMALAVMEIVVRFPITLDTSFIIIRQLMGNMWKIISIINVGF